MNEVQEFEYYTLLATHKGNMIRSCMFRNFRTEVDSSEMLRFILREVIDDLTWYFEDEYGRLKLNEEDVYFVIRHSTYHYYSGDFNCIEEVNDSFMERHYKELKHDDSLMDIFINHTHLDLPDLL